MSRALVKSMLPRETEGNLVFTARNSVGNDEAAPEIALVRVAFRAFEMTFASSSKRARVAPLEDFRSLPKMKWVLLSVLVEVCAAVALSGAETTALPISKPAVTAQITAVIEAQLAAFRAGDAEKAYGYSAAALRAQMPVRAFARMVQQNYPEIWQSTRAELGLVRDNGARATVVVHVFAKESDAAYDYILFKEPAGWRIGGVLRHEPRTGNML